MVQPAPAALSVHLPHFHCLVLSLRFRVFGFLGFGFFFPPFFPSSVLSVSSTELLATTSKRSRSCQFLFLGTAVTKLQPPGQLTPPERPLWDPPKFNFCCLSTCVCVNVCPSVWTERRHVMRK